MNGESIPLLRGKVNSGLSVFFATLCVVDIFGVFPIIALPKAIIQCGWLGIPLVLVVFALQIYTATLLGKSWIIATALDPNISRKNRYPLAAVTELTLGPRARTCVTLLLDLTVFGGGIPNLLVASQNLQLFGLKVSELRFDLSFCYWLLIVGVVLCPIMWLGSPRDMKGLAICSALIVLLTAALIWFSIIVDDAQLDKIAVPTWPSWGSLISGYGIMAFQFDVHPTLMTVQVDMRCPKNIHKAVISSFLISGTLFGVTAGLAAWKYGGGTTANVLQRVPGGYAVHTAILLAALQLILSSAVGHSALFQHLEDQFHVQRSFGWKRCAVRSAVVLLGVAIGESVPRFDIVMSLIGGSLMGPLMFIVPPLIYSRARALKVKGPQTKVPEILSTSERRTTTHQDSDPRIHSQSVHYGFLDSKATAGRYSYVYYDNDDSSEYTDYDVRDSDGLATMKMRRTEERRQPVHIDAAEPHQRQESVASQIRRYSMLQRLADYFGYCVVIVGVLITISSTYINIRNTITYVRFTPPCIVNMSIAGIGLRLN